MSKLNVVIKKKTFLEHSKSWHGENVKWTSVKIKSNTPQENADVCTMTVNQRHRVFLEARRPLEAFYEWFRWTPKCFATIFLAIFEDSNKFKINAVQHRGKAGRKH